MESGSIVFYLFAAMTVASAAMVVFLRNIVYAAFSLLLTFFGVAGLYVLLSADFLAATQVLLYVGGILVLILFGVMLTQKVMQVELRVTTIQTVPALVVVGLFIVTMLSVAFRTDWPVKTTQAIEPTTRRIGELLMTDYLLPFEIASFLLLGALVGATLLARREK